jgi:phosphatidate phosphatase APP1
MLRILSILKGLVLALVAISSPRLLAGGGTNAYVVVYDGWGTPSSFVVTGRVLEDQNEKAPKKDTGEAENLIENLKALESDEVRGAEVHVVLAGATYTATTDDDGIFKVAVKNLPATSALPLGETQVEVNVVAPQHVKARPGKGRVYIHDDKAAWVGVISDFDDTVVKTYVTEKTKMAGVLLKNGLQLEPVEGAALNYRKAKEAGVRAFFYLSGSPQNFYSRIQTYLADQGFPAGPLLLKNFGNEPITKQEGYKMSRLESLLTAHPTMKVILIGDSGEKDPEIYKELKKRHPERVLAIVIRKTANSDTTPARFEGCTVVDEKYAGDAVVASLLQTAPQVTAAGSR